MLCLLCCGALPQLAGPPAPAPAAAATAMAAAMSALALPRLGGQPDTRGFLQANQRGPPPQGRVRGRARLAALLLPAWERWGCRGGAGGRGEANFAFSTNRGWPRGHFVTQAARFSAICRRKCRLGCTTPQMSKRAASVLVPRRTGSLTWREQQLREGTRYTNVATERVSKLTLF